jgi:hypothetical protein
MHLSANRRIRQIEVTNLLEGADLDAEASIICLPDQFRTVHALVRPFESEIVRKTDVPKSGGAELRDPRCIKERVGVPQSLDYEVMAARFRSLLDLECYRTGWE